jgi:hypothetical protein
MSPFFHIPLVALLLVTFYQDWKFRAVTWFVFPLVAIVSLLIFLRAGCDWKNVGSNLIFVLTVTGTLFLYVSLHQKTLTNIFHSHFGIGDFLFFIAITEGN